MDYSTYIDRPNNEFVTIGPEDTGQVESLPFSTDWVAWQNNMGIFYNKISLYNRYDPSGILFEGSDSINYEQISGFSFTFDKYNSPWVAIQSGTSEIQIYSGNMQNKYESNGSKGKPVLFLLDNFDSGNFISNAQADLGNTIALFSMNTEIVSGDPTIYFNHLETGNFVGPIYGLSIVSGKSLISIQKRDDLYFNLYGKKENDTLFVISSKRLEPINKELYDLFNFNNTGVVEDLSPKLGGVFESESPFFFSTYDSEELDFFDSYVSGSANNIGLNNILISVNYFGQYKGIDYQTNFFNQYPTGQIGLLSKHKILGRGEFYNG